MGHKASKVLRHPGTAFVHGGKKVIGEILRNGVSVGIGANGGSISANAKVGKATVANVPIKGPAKPIQNKVPQKPNPKNPNIGGCYGVQPKQITTNFPDIKNETHLTLDKKLSVLIGKYVGESKHCVALVKALFSSLGATPNWIRGTQVKGNTKLKAGTPIATFGNKGTYLNAIDGSSHAAIFRRFVPDGIEVYDQWNGQPVKSRVIRYKNGQGTANNDADQYYVINKKSAPIKK